MPRFVLAQEEGATIAFDFESGTRDVSDLIVNLTSGSLEIEVDGRSRTVTTRGVSTFSLTNLKVLTPTRSDNGSTIDRNQLPETSIRWAWKRGR